MGECRTPLCLYENGNFLILGSEIIQQATDKIKIIRKKLKTSQDRQRSYHDKRRKSLEFQEGDHVFLKVLPVIEFGRALKSKKLSPKFIGPYQILKRIVYVAYQIVLPSNLSKLHNVIHVSQLRNYIHDPLHVIELDIVQIQENLTYDVFSVRIGDQRIKQLLEKDIPFVKYCGANKKKVTQHTNSKVICEKCIPKEEEEERKEERKKEERQKRKKKRERGRKRR